MSSDMALRFFGLLKVMTPTPSVMLCWILPSAWHFSVLLGTFSIAAAFGIERIIPPGLKHWSRVSAMADQLPLPSGELVSNPITENSIAADQMRRQRMIAGLIEESRLLGGRFQKLLVLV